MEEQDAKEIPRELRTAITEAASALNIAIEFYAEFAELVMEIIPAEDREKLRPSDSDQHYFEHQFIEEVFGKAWRDDSTDGDKTAAMIGRTPEGELPTDDEATPFIFLSVAETIAAYAVQAMKASKNGPKQNNLAWSYAVNANYWAGILTAAWERRESNEKDGMRENPAAALAKLRHAETYSMREEALKYWRDNIDPALPAAKAANALLAVVPMSHKKLAELVSAAKKKTAKGGTS